MSVRLSGVVLATIVLPHLRGQVTDGGMGPVFVAGDRDEQQKLAMYLSRITQGVVHDLECGVLIVVRH